MQPKPIAPPSLTAFLAGLIDYAGLYPPANLSLTEAISQYHHYLHSLDSWMLGHFVIGAGRLADLTTLLAEHPHLLSGRPLTLAVVGQGGESPEQFLANWETDAAAIQTFNDTHGEQAQVAQVELKLPPLPDAAALTQLIHDAQSVLKLPAFYELRLDHQWPENLALTTAGLAAAGEGVGLKLRTGGVTPEQFPTVSQVAAVLIACRDAGVPLKCTAGLHHPIRQYREEVSTKMHGFVNLFGAGILAHALRLRSAHVQLILQDERPENFCFDARGFHWQVYEVKAEQIAAARQSALISFGSCSFDEPREDIRTLGWL
ncbi:MAG: hypothetical protein KJ063_11455 [Anaerolineae bacterium]|nr:hypothetical protein [Anaerolineae bacterium]